MKMKLVAYIEEEKRYIEIWTLQVGKDCYFVQEFTSEYEKAPIYTVRLISFTTRK